MAAIVITPDAATAAPLAKAVGKRMNLVDEQGKRRNATDTEIKQFIINYLATTTEEVDAEDKREAMQKIPTKFT